ncbi:MAG: DUF167 domain-containing protein [Deltaproteobacteria bacterium]
MHRWRPDSAEVYKIKLTAPPVEGKANKALIRLIGKKLGLPKRDVHISSGAHSKLKSLTIQGLTAEAIERLLAGD